MTATFLSGPKGRTVFDPTNGPAALGAVITNSPNTTVVQTTFNRLKTVSSHRCLVNVLLTEANSSSEASASNIKLLGICVTGSVKNYRNLIFGLQTTAVGRINNRIAELFQLTANIVGSCPFSRGTGETSFFEKQSDFGRWGNGARRRRG